MTKLRRKTREGERSENSSWGRAGQGGEILRVLVGGE